MKKHLTILLLFAGLIITMTSCKSDYDKFWEIRRNASSSPITVLETPEGFRFDMSEEKWSEALNRQKPKENNYGPNYEWKFGNSKYAGYIHKVRFHEMKLCYYEIWIKSRFSNGKLVKLTSNDLNNIISHYKSKIEDETDYMNSYDLNFSFKTYVWAKNNMILELLCPAEPDYPVIIRCMNNPVWEEVEKDDHGASSYSPTTIIPSAEVKNNKWNGGVKQVEDYLASTLRDPDSYESIEWSEVKKKGDGYYVRHKYRAKNGFGGMVVTNQLFHLDFSGNVVDVKDLY